MAASLKPGDIAPRFTRFPPLRDLTSRWTSLLRKGVASYWSFCATWADCTAGSMWYSCASEAPNFRISIRTC
jgi:hypothetical protein